MTIPSRSAPPVPPGAARNTGAQQPSGSSSSSGGGGGNGWQRNGGSAGSASAMRKKPPPPRPPLPQALAASASASAHHQQQQQQPKNIASLTNIFRRMKTNDNRPKDLFSLPPPPPKGAAKSGGHPNYNSTGISTTAPFASHHSSGAAAAASASGNAVELISFDSPPTSPTPTHKSSSSWTSSLSFSSDLASTAANSGGGQSYGGGGGSQLTGSSTWQTTASQETRSESGFEDDFSSQAAFDPFSPEIGVMPQYDRAAVYGGSNAGQAAGAKAAGVSATGQSQFGWSADFLDPLCNGKSLLAPEPQVAMPTIIRPVFKAPAATAGSRYGGGGLAATQSSSGAFRAGQQTRQQPKTMAATATMAPSVVQGASHADTRVVSSVNRRRESWAIVLYQFDALQEGDLSLMPDEKVILLNQINADWFYGRNERGDEGMLPTSYVDVKQPLPADSPAKSAASTPAAPHLAEPIAPAPTGSARPARALYAFAAQTADDLSLVEGGAVGVLHAINADWWYGEATDGRRGQFPAAYVEML